jgi:hypothetical protein
VGCCEDGNESSGSIKGGESLNHLSDCQLLKLVEHQNRSQKYLWPPVCFFVCGTGRAFPGVLFILTSYLQTVHGKEAGGEDRYDYCVMVTALIFRRSPLRKFAAG